MKLALIIGSLGGGGAERVMAALANAWVQGGVTVTLITIGDAGTDCYSLDSRVERIGLGLSRESIRWWQKLANNYLRVRALRSALRSTHPDGILSFLPTTNVLSVLAAHPLKIPVVVSERVSPEHDKHPMAWRALRAFAYRRAVAMTIQTERGAVWLKQRIPGVPVRVIPNPVQMEGEMLDAAALGVMSACRDQNIVLAVGRLAVQKGYDLLLHAFVSTAADHPEWRLVILGEGPERHHLEAQVRELGLTGRVLLPGFSSTPQALMRRAQLFVLPSRFEGFPNALLEAMACGLPCVSFACPTGPAELITHEIDGLLVPPQDTNALAAALGKLMDDPAFRDRLGRAAQAVASAYSLDSILARWNALLETCGIMGDKHG